MFFSVLQRSFVFLSYVTTVIATPAHSHIHALAKERRDNGYETVTVKFDSGSPDHDRDFQRFITRPDIDAPRWNFTVYDADAVAPGYWFASPYQVAVQKHRGGEWVGPTIYDSHGELIWSGGPLFENYGLFDFKVQQYEGEDVMTGIYRHEHAMIINNRYEIIKRMYTDQPDYVMNVHEFNIVANGTRVLLLTNNEKGARPEVAAEIGLKKCTAHFYGFQELLMSTMEPLFTWSSEGVIPLSDSYDDLHRMQEHGCQGFWDYIHVNALDKFPDGDYLISARNCDTLYRISGKDGSIVWRFGGRHSDFEWADHFSGQHHCRVRSSNTTHSVLSFLDNEYRPGHPVPPENLSRGFLVQLDHVTGRATTLEKYEQPHSLIATGRGSYQTLPGGNTLIGWTDHAAFTEYGSANGALHGPMVLDATLRADLKSYRNYKFPWKGDPQLPPDVYAIVSAPGLDSLRTDLYVSWNGATEVQSWNFYLMEFDEKSLIASVPRRGFETHVVYEGFAGIISAEAVDADGNVIGTSKNFTTIVSLGTAEDFNQDDLQWFQDHSSEGLLDSFIPSAGFPTMLVAAFAAGVVCTASVVLLVFLVWRYWSWMVRPFTFLRREKTEYQPLAEKGDADEEP